MSLTPSISFVVEEQLEKRFLQNVCPNAKIMLVNNGVSVAIPALAKRVAALIRTQPKRELLTVIIFDREGRKGSSQSLAVEMRECLIKLGIASSSFLVGCPDRMIENWMLADQDVVVEYVGLQDHVFESEHEGTSGKATMKKLFQAAGKKYHETTSGVELLKKCRPHAMSLKSLSAAAFFSSLNAGSCWWLSASAT